MLNGSKTYSAGISLQIATALEKIYDAYKVMLWQQASAVALTPLQIQVVLYLNRKGFARLSDIAKDQQLSKPTASDTVKTLESKKIIDRKTLEIDKRTQLIYLNENGQRLAFQLTSYTNPLVSILQTIGNNEQEQLYPLLLQVIEATQTASLVANSNMCFTCRFYEGDKHNRHYCHLLEKEILASHLKLHCNDHQMIL